MANRGAGSFMIRNEKIRCRFHADVRISMFVSASLYVMVPHVQRQLSNRQVRTYGERE